MRQEYASALLDQVKEMFDYCLVKERAGKLKGFYCGDRLALGDVCLAAFYTSIKDREPSLIAIILNNY